MATASFAVFPQKGSALAEWAGLQKPSDYTVASRLPAGDWLMVTAARIDYGPMRGFLTDIAAAKGKPELAEWIGVFGQDGAFALFAQSDRTVRAAGLIAVTDAKKLGQLVTAYVKKMAAQPTAMDSMEVTAKANAHRTGGASLHAITVKPGAQSSPEEKKEFEKAFGKAGMKSYFGLAGDWLVVSLGKDPASKGMATKLVQSSKAKQPKSTLSETFEKALAESKSRNESGVMAFDLSVLAHEPAKAKGAEVTFGLGFEGSVIRRASSCSSAAPAAWLRRSTAPRPVQVR
jgi:hypothetical protein